MAHFAQISENNTVEQVVVISNDDLLDENGVEQESLGVAICQKIYGGGTWAQTSFNGNFNGEFAQPGFIYSAEHHVFRSPEQPFPSWVVSQETGLWEAPVPKPNSSYLVAWNENGQTWVEHRTEVHIDGVRYWRPDEESEWLVWDEQSESMVPADPQPTAP